MECPLMLMPFTKDAASLHAKPAKHKLHLSDERNNKPAILMRWRTIYTTAHTQVFKIHSKYIKLIYVFGSAHVKIGVLIKAGPQPLFPAEPGVKNGWADPNYISPAFRIDSDAVLHMNLIQRESLRKFYRGHFCLGNPRLHY